VISVTSTQDSMALLAKERLDASAGGVSAAFFNAVHRGFDMRACASIAYQPKNGAPTCLMIRRDLYDKGITKPQQLKGERIALIGGVGGAPSYLAAQWIAPLTFHDVDMIPMGMPDTGIALARKAVAAAVVFSPFTVAFEKRGLAKVVAVQKVGTSTTALMLGKRLLDDRSKAKAVRMAFVRAARDLAGDGYYSPSTLEILSKHTGASIAALREEPRYAFADGLPLDLQTLEDMQRTFIEERTVTYKAPMPPEKIAVRL
jgi:ABC-type nitrate/sulfonate/bicarbonate transport system substrate-binding protein